MQHDGPRRKLTSLVFLFAYCFSFWILSNSLTGSRTKWNQCADSSGLIRLPVQIAHALPRRGREKRKDVNCRFTWCLNRRDHALLITAYGTSPHHRQHQIHITNPTPTNPNTTIYLANTKDKDLKYAQWCFVLDGVVAADIFDSSTSISSATYK